MKHVCGSVYKTIKKIRESKKQKIIPITSPTKKIKPKKLKPKKLKPKKSRLSIRTNRSLSINTNIPYHPPKSFKSIM